MPQKKDPHGLVPFDRVRQTILLLRGQRIILDADLARLYGVPTKRLNEQVRRNRDRFPEDFRFHLSSAEKREVVANCDHLQFLKFSPQLPYAFTEHGAIMAATVLNSKEAVKASLFVVRAFVQLREVLSTHRDLAAKIDELERHLQNHDEQILTLFDAIRQLMEDPDTDDPAKPPIGFHTELAAPRSSAKSPRRLSGKITKPAKAK